MNYTYSVCPKCKSLNKVLSEKALVKTPLCGKCGNKLSFYGLVSEVTGEDFKRILKKSDLPVIVDFWAEWCGPCKMYGPQFEQASKENQKAVFLKINTEIEPSVSSELKIHGIPCTIIFKNGKEVKRQAGAMNARQLNDFCK